MVLNEAVTEGTPGEEVKGDGVFCAGLSRTSDLSTRRGRFRK